MTLTLPGQVRLMYYVEPLAHLPVHARSSTGAAGGNHLRTIFTPSPPRPGSLRCRVVADHSVDEVGGAAVGMSSGSGDVGLAVGAVVSDGGVAQQGGDGGPVAGTALVG